MSPDLSVPWRVVSSSMAESEGVAMSTTTISWSSSPTAGKLIHWVLVLLSSGRSSSVSHASWLGVLILVLWLDVFWLSVVVLNVLWLSVLWLNILWLSVLIFVVLWLLVVLLGVASSLAVVLWLVVVLLILFLVVLWLSILLLVVLWLSVLLLVVLWLLVLLSVVFFLVVIGWLLVGHVLDLPELWDLGVGTETVSHHGSLGAWVSMSVSVVLRPSVGESISVSMSDSISVSVSVGPSLGVATANSVTISVVRGSWLVSEVDVVVANTETSLEGVTVLTELRVSVSMAISTAKSASVTSAGVADIGVALVIPVVVVIVVSVWVLETIWSPGEVVSTVDFSVMVIKSVDIAWLEVTMSPDSIVLVVTIVLGWSPAGTLTLISVTRCSSTDSQNSKSSSFHILDL